MNNSRFDEIQTQFQKCLKLKLLRANLIKDSDYNEFLSPNQLLEHSHNHLRQQLHPHLPINRPMLMRPSIDQLYAPCIKQIEWGCPNQTTPAIIRFHINNQQRVMRNSIAPLAGLLLLSIIQVCYPQTCQADTRLPGFHQLQTRIESMHRIKNTAGSSAVALKYLVNYPLELISAAGPNNIESILSIQNMETGEKSTDWQYRASRVKSQTAILVTVDNANAEWRNCVIRVLLFNRNLYSNIAVGQIALGSIEGRLSTSGLADLPATLKSTDFKTLIYIVGIKASLKNKQNPDYEIEIRETVDIGTKQVKVSVNSGENTILSEIYLSYLAYAKDDRYEIYTGYSTLSQNDKGSYYAYLGEGVSSSEYFLAGISSIKVRKPIGAFGLSFDAWSQYPSFLQVSSKQPLSILTVGVFRIGKVVQNLCEKCPDKIVGSKGLQTLCLTTCEIGAVSLIGSVTTKCISCPSQLNFVRNSSNVCVCNSGFQLVNSQCVATQTRSKALSDFAPTFSRSDSSCVEQNTVKSPSTGQCICKPGYQRVSASNINTCQPQCRSQLGYFNGQTCIRCPQGSYPWHQLQTCINCGDYCQTCRSEYACSECTAGFEVNPATNQCEQACGDGIVIIRQCDDGNKVGGDGCSASCGIEDGYTCTIVKGKSQCMRLNLEIKRKDLRFTSGSLLVQYEVKPPLNRLYSSSELAEFIKISWLSALPYQVYLNHNPYDLSSIRIVASYGNNIPTRSADFKVEFTFPSVSNFSENVSYSFVREPRRTFSRSIGSDKLN